MQIVLEIPNDKAQGIVDAFCYFNNYQQMVVNPEFDPDLPVDESNTRLIPNPESRNQFAMRMLRLDIKRTYYRHQRILQKDQAEANLYMELQSFDIT